MTISKVVITATTKEYNGNPWIISTGSFSVSNEKTTWTGSETSAFTLKNNNSKQLRWTSIEVTYTVTAPTTSYTVNFDAGTNGTCSTTEITEQNPGDGVTLPSCTPNDGYAFVGWATSSDATTANAGVAGETYHPTADVTLYAVYANLYTVTIETPENGTLIVKNGETEVSTGSYVADGTELTIVATPNNGYKFKNWQYKEGDGSWITKTANFTYTINSNNVSFQANFDEIVYNTITWNVNGVTTTEKVENGTAITFAKPTENIPDGYVFMGWSATEIPTQQEAPAYVTNATAEIDVTYFAVFAKQNGSTTTKTVTLTVPEPSNTTYRDMELTDDLGNIWTCHAQTILKGGNLYFGLNPNQNAFIASPNFSGDITKITMNTYNDYSAYRFFYICSDNSVSKPSEGDIAEIKVPSKTNDELFSVDVTGSHSQFYIYSSGYLLLRNIVVTYNEGSVSYSDYCTSVTPETVTYTPANLTLVAKDKDGAYWATFSSNETTFFNVDDVDLNTVYVEGNEFIMLKNDKVFTEDIQTIGEDVIDGYYVPANTGVLIYSLTPSITYYTVSGKNVQAIDAESNMLYPSSYEMSNFGDGYYFYKLAYDNFSAKTGLGLYWGAENGGAFTSKEGLAYLAVSKNATAKSGFAFDNSTSGIESVDTETSKNDVMYNLAGMRVNNSYKGIVIVNGKKMIRK